MRLCRDWGVTNFDLPIEISGCGSDLHTMLSNYYINTLERRIVSILPASIMVVSTRSPGLDALCTLVYIN